MKIIAIALGVPIVVVAMLMQLHLDTGARHKKTNSFLCYVNATKYRP